MQVNQILDKIQAVHPEWCEKTMAAVEAKINAANQEDNDAPVAESAASAVKSMDVS